METGMISTTTSAATAAAQASTTGASNTSMGQDGFLKLLVAQLKNQDPTGAGQDPNQMVQQLTSFSTLEQAQKTNTLLTGLQTQTGGLFQAQAMGMVGKTVRVDGSGFNLKSGSAAMNLTLSSSANVNFTVKDATGKLVAVLPQGTLSRGDNVVTWDGKDANGIPLPDGAYKVEVTANGTDGKPVPFTTSLTMKVDAVTFKNNGVYLASGSSIFSLADVLEVTA